jgi:hypothetical protein
MILTIDNCRKDKGIIELTSRKGAKTQRRISQKEEVRRQKRKENENVIDAIDMINRICSTPLGSGR